MGRTLNSPKIYLKTEISKIDLQKCWEKRLCLLDWWQDPKVWLLIETESEKWVLNIYELVSQTTLLVLLVQESFQFQPAKVSTNPYVLSSCYF